MSGKDSASLCCKQWRPWRRSVWSGRLCSSVFSASQKDRLAKAISNKVAAGGAAARGEKPPVTQTFTSPLRYFSESDWDVFADMRRTTQQVALRMAQRLRLLNADRLSEDSFSHLAALVAAARASDASEVELFGIVLELKTACSGLVQAGGVVPFLWEFPVDPGNLPQALHDRAYARESPVAKSLEQFRVLEQRWLRRRTHKALRGTPILMPGLNARTPVLMPAGSQSDATATAPLANLVVQLLATAAGQQCQVSLATCSRFRATPAARVQAHQTRAPELKMSLMRMLQQKIWELKLRQAALELHLSRRLHIHRRRSSHHPRRWLVAIGAHPIRSSRHPSCSCRFAASRSWMPRHPSCSCRVAASRSSIPHHPSSLAEAG